MKASRLSEAQKAFILKQGNHGMPMAEICWRFGTNLTSENCKPNMANTGYLILYTQAL